jgi:hypothetical protein
MHQLAKHIATARVEAVKIQQAHRYLEGVKTLLARSDFWLPTMDVSDYKNLRGFPLVICLSVADRFLTHLRDSGILVRFELNDSPWSEKQKIIYLPMGLHINYSDISQIISVIEAFTMD